MNTMVHHLATGAQPVPAPSDLDLDGIEALARTTIGPMASAYYAGGSGEQELVARARDAWQQVDLWPKVLRNVGMIDTSTTVLGKPVATPVLVAPTALHGLAHPDAELATARAAAEVGSIFTLSSLSNTAMEEVVAAAPDARQWMQLYVLRDRGFTTDMVARIAAAGFEALVLTVDAPVSGLRCAELRAGVHLPSDLELPNLAPAAVHHAKDEGFMAVVTREFDPSLSFADLEWLVATSPLPVIVKGIVRGDDAEKAADAGAVGIIVSNHGARQLNASVPTAVALPRVVEAVQGRAEVYVDGGIRRPDDVVRALAMGARAVLLGRPVLWSLGAGGQGGVTRLLGWFTDELRRSMALCGTASIDEITADLLRG